MKDILISGADRMGIEISEDTADRFTIYMNMLIDYNTRLNLTAITNPRDIITKHFLDSLTPVSQNLIKKDAYVCDVGCGAGFPSLPIKLVRPDIKLVMIDSLNKRLKFLDDVIAKLELTDVKTVHARAEDAGQNPLYREQFDVSVSRAVANLKTLSEWCIPLVKPGGIFIALKGPMVLKELEPAKDMISLFGGSQTKIIEADIPFTELNHKTVIIKKIKQTPRKYPQKPGKATKKPEK